MQGTFSSFSGASATPVSVTDALGKSHRGEKLLTKHPDMQKSGGGLVCDKRPQVFDFKKKRKKRNPAPKETKTSVVHSALVDSFGNAKRRARDRDMEYARLVAGGLHVRSLASVWGPRDGTGMNAVDTKSMQDELFEYITEQIGRRYGLFPTP